MSFDAVLGIGLAAQGDVPEREIEIRGTCLVHCNDRSVGAHDLHATQALAIDARDATVDPVDDALPAGYRAFGEPRQRVVGDANVELGAGGIGLRWPPVAEHPVRELGARIVLQRETHRLRILAGRILEPQLRVALGVARLRLDPLHPRYADEQLVNPVRIHRITVLLLDAPGVAAPHQVEGALACGHANPHDGVQLLEQRREDDLAGTLRRVRIPIDNDDRADCNRGRGRQDQY